MAKYTVFKGHNSPITVRMTKANGAFYTAEEMSGITRAYFKYIPDTAVAEYADSGNDEHTSCFDWSTYASESLIMFDVGLLDFTVGSDSKAELIVYDGLFTSGRVIAQLDTTISDEALGDISAVDVLTIIEAGESTFISPLTVDTASYQILSGDVGRSIRVDPDITTDLILPLGTAGMDGKFLYILVTDTGSVDVTCSGTNKIGDDSNTVLTITGAPYAHVPLEYVHSLGVWMVHRMGGISGS